ncbi:MAG TPA: orotidine-5'-phosphate decarboxylase [Gemmatales bacterium]|nr:orotidine-5'-phosphate decarboxylase [Gemmatales bacterium]
MQHYADRLYAGIQDKRSPLCVGLDPRWESLPHAITRQQTDTLHGRGKAYEAFCVRVLDLVHPYTAIVKPQSAFFEVLGAPGHEAMERIIEKAHALGLLVILDAKRNDIASTATAYAEAAFVQLKADALTINPYLGRDAVEPFISEARKHQAGLYVLVRTSNPGAGQFQDLKTEQGKVHEVVAQAVNDWTKENLGTSGFGDIGAVVGATSPQELAHLRTMMPHVPFLVPGYGAQGGSAADCKGAFNAAGLGAVINSSRGITFPFKPDDAHWEEKIVQAAKKAASELAP